MTGFLGTSLGFKGISDLCEKPEDSYVKSINMDMDARSVRLDVYVKDEKELRHVMEGHIISKGEVLRKARKCRKAKFRRKIEGCQKLF